MRGPTGRRTEGQRCNKETRGVMGEEMGREERCRWEEAAGGALGFKLPRGKFSE
jgi:hypothetical protein